MTAPRLTQSLPPVAELFRAHGRFAWRALRRHGVPDRDLEDAVQEVFLIVHRRRGDVYVGTRVETWIYGVCVRVAAGYRRRAHVRKEQLAAEPPEGAAVPDESPTPLCHVENRRDLEQLHRVLDTLPAAVREVFVLYEVEGLNLRETAEALGIPEGTATSRLYAGRRRVQQAFRAMPEQEVGT